MVVFVLIKSLAGMLDMYMGIVLNYCQYGVLYLGSYYNTGPYRDFPHFGNSNLGKLPYSSCPISFPFNSPILALYSWFLEALNSKAHPVEIENPYKLR